MGIGILYTDFLFMGLKFIREFQIMEMETSTAIKNLILIIHPTIILTTMMPPLATLPLLIILRVQVLLFFLLNTKPHHCDER